jgi:hypothetical protein
MMDVLSTMKIPYAITLLPVATIHRYRNHRKIVWDFIVQITGRKLDMIRTFTCLDCNLESAIKPMDSSFEAEQILLPERKNLNRNHHDMSLVD